jgi:ATP-binding cassette subfamily A (ABC1) protein 3
VHQLIGYCPQFDAVLEDLTGYETLTMFCLLRGIPKEKCRYVINYLAEELLFKKHINKKVKEYRYSTGITVCLHYVPEYF